MAKKGRTVEVVAVAREQGVLERAGTLVENWAGGSADGFFPIAMEHYYKSPDPSADSAPGL